VRTAVSTTVAVRLFKLVAGVLASVITARALGPTGRGEFFVVVTVAAVVVQFANLGLHASNTYLVARDRSLLAPLSANSLWAALGIGGACALAAASLAVVRGQFFELPAALALFLLPLVPGGLFLLLVLNLLIGSGRVSLFNSLDAVGSALSLLLIALAALVLPTTAGFLSAASMAAVLACIAAWIGLRRIVQFSLGIHTRLFQTGLLFALKAYAVSVLSIITLRANVLILQYSSGPSDVGTYSIALQIADVLGILPGSIALVLFPRLIGDRSQPWPTALRNSAAVGLMLVAASALTSLLAPHLIPALFGVDFASAADALTLLLPGVVLLGMATVLSQFLAAIGFPSSLVIAWGIIAAVAVALSITLVPTLGATGAALSLSATYAIHFVVIAVLAFHHRRQVTPLLKSAA
jgi:antigen flippase